MAGIFKAYDIRGIYGDALTLDTAYWIGLGAATCIYQNSGEVLVSRDMRWHSVDLMRCFIDGLLDGGCDVLSMGLASTPMTYWANQHLNVAGSVTITASHNPAAYNGFKFSRANALPVSYTNGIAEIEQFVTNRQMPEAKERGRCLVLDQDYLLTEYLNWNNQFMPQSNRKLKVAIDASNGMAGSYLQAFVQRYDWLDVTPIYWELDGTFPHHEADPQKTENLRDTQSAVRANECDFGVCFDGDADRAVFVDEHGMPISSDLMTALIASDYLMHGSATIGYDLRSSLIVEETISALGGMPARTKVGHSHIKKQMREEGIKFAGELSGHFYYEECGYTDSALMTLVKVLSILQRTGSTLSSLINQYRKYHSPGEISYQVHDCQAAINKIQETYQHCQQDMLDGLTVRGDSWWFNVRASNTEPLLRLNLEAKDYDLMHEKLQEVQGVISSCGATVNAGH